MNKNSHSGDLINPSEGYKCKNECSFEDLKRKLEKVRDIVSEMEKFFNGEDSSTLTSLRDSDLVGYVHSTWLPMLRMALSGQPEPHCVAPLVKGSSSLKEKEVYAGEGTGICTCPTCGNSDQKNMSIVSFEGACVYLGESQKFVTIMVCHKCSSMFVDDPVFNKGRKIDG